MANTKKLTQLDKEINRIEKWNELQVFQHLKYCWDETNNKHRDIIAAYSQGNYEGTQLESHDRYVAAVNQVFDKEFKKLYERVKRTNRSKRSKD